MKDQMGIWQGFSLKHVSGGKAIFSIEKVHGALHFDKKSDVRSFPRKATLCRQGERDTEK